MHFDLIDLRLYLHVLDAGNITAGASRSHLSLAAASARIRAMEAALGVECLERGRRGITPTAAGQALARHARLLLQQAEHLQQDLAEYANGVKGQVRLLCNTTALSEYLPELLADFLRDHPNLDIDLQELPSLRITQALRQGTADLGIISDAVDTHGLQTLAFRDDPLVLGHAAGASVGGKYGEFYRQPALRLCGPGRPQRAGGVPGRTGVARGVSLAHADPRRGF
jgi:DNA-binding transcriptional LysR family regulator